ncbi:hypothetical protein D3OALGA1CA_1226 [Olavius algarvensis associated proteobacterium Delta 3]|nr:hypothetical protein D3OALGA1CA_1226 [Olavius algarvensis associated proteobacterium Delta 3]CAB5103142.1 hypothetical protein D3OALGB2SA_1961 [Olavius algarvensis associated proteobacterium Delta 3]
MSTVAVDTDTDPDADTDDSAICVLLELSNRNTILTSAVDVSGQKKTSQREVHIQLPLTASCTPMGLELAPCWNRLLGGHRARSLTPLSMNISVKA